MSIKKSTHFIAFIAMFGCAYVHTASVKIIQSELASIDKGITSLEKTVKNFPVAPAENDVVAPAENDVVAPAENDVVAPAANDVVAPAENDVVAPVDSSVALKAQKDALRSQLTALHNQSSNRTVRFNIKYGENGKDAQSKEAIAKQNLFSSVQSRFENTSNIAELEALLKEYTNTVASMEKDNDILMDVKSKTESMHAKNLKQIATMVTGPSDKIMLNINENIFYDNAMKNIDSTFARRSTIENLEEELNKIYTRYMAESLNNIGESTVINDTMLPAPLSSESTDSDSWYDNSDSWNEEKSYWDQQAAELPSPISDDSSSNSFDSFDLFN